MRRKPSEKTGDASQLWPTIEEIARDLEEQSLPHQPETKLFYDDLTALVREELLLYSKQLARGEIARAKRTLKIIGQKLAALALSATNTSDQTPDEALTGSRRLYNDAAETLSVEIDMGLGFYRKLEDIHRELGSCLQEVIQAADQWTLSDDIPSVQGHIVWLLDTSEGFNARVSSYFLDPSLEQEDAMRKLLDEAKQRLDTLQVIIDQAETARQNTKEAMSPKLDNLPKQAAQLLKRLLDVRRAIQMLPGDTVNEVVSSSELLTPEELARWRYYEEHTLFGNFDRVRGDLVNQAQRIWRRLDDAPSLSDETRAGITDARRYVERLCKRFGAPADIEASALPATPSAKRKVQPAKQIARPQPVSAAPLVEDERLDEIYQFAVAVASYKYCSPRHLVGMTATSILGTLASLGKITETEKEEYRKPLAEKLKSRSLRVDDRREIRSLWEETSPREYDWIYFKPKTSGNRWLWRLVQKAQAPGQEIARRLGITHKAVEKAATEYREDQLRRKLLREEED